MDIKEIVIDYSPVELSEDTRNKIYKTERMKQEISRKRPFEGALLKQVKDFYRIDIVWSSEALEGNTLTLDELSIWMDENENTMNPVEYAAELHRKLVYIHPFEDGNGRIARLAMNTKLIQSGYLPCAVAPIHRLDYNNALEAGRRGEREQFISLIADIEFETQKDFMRYMHMQMPEL